MTMTTSKHRVVREILQSISALIATVALIVVVVLAVHTGHELQRDQDRTCRVLNTKIESEIRLRHVQIEASSVANAASRKSMSANMAVLHALPRSPFAHTPVAALFRRLLQSNIMLQHADIAASNKNIGAAERFIATWHELARELRCG
jgi:sensor domain CHASE-containing protein